MRKDKLKINFQRMGVFFVCILMLTSLMVYAVPVFAAETDLYHDEPVDFGLGSGVCPATLVGAPAGTYEGFFIVPGDESFVEADTLVINGDNWSFYYDNQVVFQDTRVLEPVVFIAEPSSLGEAAIYLKYVYYLDYVFDENISSLVGDFSFVTYIPLNDEQGGLPAIQGGSFTFADGAVGNFQVLLEAGGATDSFVAYNDGWTEERYRYLAVVSAFDQGSLFALSWNMDRSSDGLEASFLDRVTSGLTAVIGWVGVVVSAVISGPLSPLLGLVAVGIAVSAILLVVYLIRRFIWGA